MAIPTRAWGVEIGGNALKAICLQRTMDGAEIVDFVVIPHKKVLSDPDHTGLERNEIIRFSLGQFLSQKGLEGEHIVMSVPGHSAFARFAKLPPVDPKKIPDIVRFEAEQQIPFPLEEVEWDYATFSPTGAPEVEVGIFAITRDRVHERLELYSELGLSPEALTLSPVAIYNALAWDLDFMQQNGSGGQAGTASGHWWKRGKGTVDGEEADPAEVSGRVQDPIVLLDIGTEATDVVVASGDSCWIRTFPLGGTHFTRAIQDTFKLSYPKAEKLKKEASTSKYTKQIMQAMRPVFTDLLSEIQQSIGYYQRLHEGMQLKRVLGLGSTFRIPGLRKFIGNQLQVNVERLSEFKKIALAGREAASFVENTLNMATAYGLALQGLGMASINANLVPVSTLRQQMWMSKTKWFAAAAAVLLLGLSTLLISPLLDKADLGLDDEVQEATRIITKATGLRDEYQEAVDSVSSSVDPNDLLGLVDYRTVWPWLVHDIYEAAASSRPDPVLLSGDLERILRIDPQERALIQVQDIEGAYTYAQVQPSPDPGGPGDGTSPAGRHSRRIHVQFTVEVSHEDPFLFLNETVEHWLREHAEPSGVRAEVPYRIDISTINLSRAYVEKTVGDDGAVSGGSRQGIPGRQTGRGAIPPGDIDPQRTPQPGAGDGKGGGNIPNFGGPGGEGGGRRQSAGGRRAPGSGLGTGGGSPVPGGASPHPPSRSPGSSSPSRPSGPENTAEILDEAPLPLRPLMYPAGTVFYEIPISFEVELLEPGTRETPGRSAAAGHERGAVVLGGRPSA